MHEKQRRPALLSGRTWLALVLVLGLAVWYWSQNLSPTARATAAAHRFWSAAVRGDASTIESMLADEADFTPADVIRANTGLRYDRQKVAVLWVRGPSPTGTEVLVVSSLSDPREPTRSVLGRSLALKRVNGTWKVTRQGTSFTY